MKEIEQKISSLVETQFPEFYASEGPRFVDFVQQYYVWMESQNQAVNRSRNLFNYRDIDRTSEEFVGLFKNKFLKGFPLTTEANTQFLAKHATDIYSAKGTDLAVEMTMRALFNEDSTVNYPSRDLFKLSDGTWVKPVYLELAISERTKNFIGKQIIGSRSSAKAFMEALVTERINGKFIHVAYLTNVEGDFITNEFVTPTDDTNLYEAPQIIGSMTTLTVMEGGANFAVGDIFEVTSPNGRQGKARVTAINNETGKVRFIFINALKSGGWGYSFEHANVMIAQKMLQIGATTNANTQITGFAQFEQVSQNFANIGYSTARPNNANFAVGGIVENYYANGLLAANAVIVSTGITTDTSGYLVVSPASGNLISADTVLVVKADAIASTFNALSGVANTTEITTTTSPHGFSNGAAAVYTVSSGNTAVSGLTSGSTYYIVNTVIGTSTLQLSATRGGSPVNLTAGVDELGHTLTRTVAPATFNAATGINLATKRITTTATHTFVNNDVVVYSTRTGNTALTTLSEGAAYCIISANATTFQLADTATGTAISLSAGKNETGHYFTKSFGSGLVTSFADRTATGMVIQSNTQYVGVINISSSGFLATPYANIVGSISNTVSVVNTISTGTGATFKIGTLTDTENVYLTPDFLHSNNTQNVVFSTINLTGNNSGNSLQYSTSYTSTFNGYTSINDATKFISEINTYSFISSLIGTVDLFPANYGLSTNQFVNSTPVVYRVAPGNTAITNLSNNASYYVVSANTTAFQLSTTKDRLESVVDASAGINGTTFIITPVVYSSTFNALTGVSTPSEFITTSTPHSFVDGDRVLYTVAAGNTAVSGLANNTTYYIRNANSTAFQLATSYVGAAINLTAGLNQTGHTLTRNHGLVNNNIVAYVVSPSNTAIVGLTNGSSYYVVNASSTTFQLSTTASGTAISLTPGTSETGHKLTSIVQISPNINEVGHSFTSGGRMSVNNDALFGGYGFEKFPAGNIDSTLLDCLRFDSTIIGSIGSITGLNTGQDYNVDPFVVVLDPYTYGYQKHDYWMNITPVSGAFVVGEEIQQSFSQPAIQLTVTGFTGVAANGVTTTTVAVNEQVYQNYANGSLRAKGFVVEAGIASGSGTIKLANVTGTFIVTVNAGSRIRSLTTGGLANTTVVTTTTLATTAKAIVKEVVDSSTLRLKRINLESTFGNGNTVIGQVSGSVGTIVNFDQDFSVPAVGVNANIVANVQTANAVATGLSVYDSGFGYLNQETVTLTKADSDYTITAIVQIEKQGTGAGFYSSTKGFLDSDKKLHDNEYYQEYSYEVVSKIPFDKYIDVLKQVTHVAGTKAFGKLISTSIVDATPTIKPASISLS